MECLAPNPAELSPMLSALFPRGSVAASLCGPGNPRLLHPAEARCVARAAPQRLREFAAGRACARRAMAELGIVDFSLQAADDRQPVWPAPMVGSITHTRGFCAAVVAERQSALALGLDSERVGDVRPELWQRICVPSELAWIRSVPALHQAAAATLIFSAKEAFYKCQYSLVRERVTFHDVRVEAAWGACGGAFQIHANRRLAVSTRAAMPLQGLYLHHQALITAGIGLAPGEDRAQ